MWSNDINIVQSCIQSMRGFDLTDITRVLFLVCMGIKIENMLLF